MLRLIFLMLFFTSVLSSSAQGGWNIGYIPIDTLNKGHIGRIVRIDFKTLKVVGEPSTTRYIRSYVGTKDTGFISIDTALLTVAERRKIYVDYGSYDDQFLECLNCKGLTLRIYDAEILDVGEQSILFGVETEQLRKGIQNIKSSKVVRIEKAKLDGVLYKL